MSDFLNAMKNELNYTTTENGAIALNSTMNACLDMFGSFGSLMDGQENTNRKAIELFRHAFKEDRKLAMKLLFYMRDIRGGQGVRDAYRACLNWLACNYPDYVINNFENIFFFGRGDDFYCLTGNNSFYYLVGTDVEDKMFEFIHKIFLEDMATIGTDNPCSLLGKWLKSPNTSSKESSSLGKLTAKKFHMTEKSYRKALRALREKIGVIESYMSHNEWDKINFENVPSRASMIYRDAFYKHQEDRYLNYLTALETGDAKVNASVLYPYDIIHKIWGKVDLPYNIMKSNKKSIDYILYNALWNSLPNYFEGKDESGICVVDVSGSMYGTPIEVALSLGLYCADKCTGSFKNHFITFSRNPKLHEIQGDNIYDKVNDALRADWGMNTDLERVFNLILRTAKEYNCTDIPKKLYIISDMQFDSACEARGQKQTLMQDMRKKFEEANLEFPSIVYWNVNNSECGMFQQDFQGENCCMVSGYSASLFKAVIEGTEYEEEVKEDGTKVVKQKLDPMTVMLNTINNERYDRVWVGEK